MNIYVVKFLNMVICIIMYMYNKWRLEFNLYNEVLKWYNLYYYVL